MGAWVWGCRLEAGIHQVSEVVLLDLEGASHLWGTGWVGHGGWSTKNSPETGLPTGF